MGQKEELNMDFFEKLGKKATETFNSAAEKTTKLAGETKLRLKINDCKSKIKEQYENIGKIVYQHYVLDGNIDIKDEIAEQLEKISGLTDEIEDYERQILESKNMKQCENCKNTIERSAKFCPECGAEQPEEPAQEVEVVEEDVEETAEEAENVAEEINEEKEENQ